jgi:hypothetical protein
LFKTEDYGKTWKKIINGIEAEHFTRVIRVDPSQKGVLYAGTETQVYISFDDGKNWESLQLNLPIVPITDLTIKDDNLIAATQGRGLWMIDDLSVIRQNQKRTTEQSNYLFKPKPAYKIKGSQNKNVKGAGINHPGGVMTYFDIKEYDDKKDTIQLLYFNSVGDTIRYYSNKADDKENELKFEKGLNLFTWNMRHENAKRFQGMILWWGSLSGAEVLPGDYAVELIVNGVKQRQNFEILADPRVNYSVEELAGKYKFMQEVNQKISEAHQCIGDIKDLKSQMKDFLKKHESVSIKEKINEIDSSLTLIENELYQTKIKSGQDPLNYPIKLTNKLAHLNSLINISEAPPTDQMIEVKNELVEKIDKELSKFKEIANDGLKVLNTLIKSEITDFIILQKE